MLVPSGRSGASVVTALVEALDQAVQIGRDAISVQRGEVSLTLLRPHDWPAPARAPSEALAGRPGGALDLSTTPESRVWRMVARARAALGPATLAVVRAQPARRRELAEQRRAAERRYWILDANLRSRRGKGAGFLTIALTGLGSAVFFSLLGTAGFAASGALLFLLGAAGVAFETVASQRATARLGAARLSIAQLAQQHEDLDANLRKLTAWLPGEDPWALAEHLEALGDEPPRLAVTDQENNELRSIARRLADLLDVDPVAVEQSSCWAWSSPGAADSWPLDVAIPGGRDESVAALVGMARLLHRVQRDLPPPWPVVLWDPWNQATPEDRARRLMALAAVAERRPVIAVARV